VRHRHCSVLTSHTRTHLLLYSCYTHLPHQNTFVVIQLLYLPPTPEHICCYTAVILTSHTRTHLLLSCSSSESLSSKYQPQDKKIKILCFIIYYNEFHLFHWFILCVWFLKWILISNLQNGDILWIRVHSMCTVSEMYRINKEPLPSSLVDLLCLSSFHLILCSMSRLNFLCCFGPPSTATTLHSLCMTTRPVMNSCLVLASILNFLAGFVRSFIL
jgi:hypothetical protein